MKKIYSPIFLIFLFVFYMCSKSTIKNGEDILEIDITNLPKKTIGYGDSIYLKSSRVVELATTDASLIGQIHQLEIFDNKIYILDGLTSTILVYDLDGRYVNKIGMKGSGGGEYLNVNSFYIDEKENTINIVDNLRSTVLRYSKEGHFMQKIGHNNSSLNFAKKIKVIGDLLFCYAATNWDGNNMYFIADKNNLSKLKEVRKYVGNYTVTRSFNFSNQPFACIDGELHFSSLFTDTIFSYKNDTIFPCIIIKNKPNVSSTILNKRLEDCQYDYRYIIKEILRENTYNTGILNYFENKRYVLCDFMVKDKPIEAILWDKIKKQGIYLDDYSYGLGLSYFISTSNNTIIRVWDAMDIHLFQEELTKNKTLESEYPVEIIELINSYNSEEDNPILLLYEFKED